jgi:hypothetical protein
MAKTNKAFRFALLAKDIEEKRLSIGVTLAKMSTDTGVPLSTCQRAEKGMITAMEINTVIALCNFVQQPVQKYLTHENKNNKKPRKLRSVQD